jgi:HK97 family phage prohead protease
MNEERVYKSFTTTVKDIDQQGRLIVAANAFGNVDSHQDVSLPGSFNKTLKENFNRLRWFLNHDTRILLGVPLQGKEVFPYLELEGQLNMNKQVSRDIYEDYKLYAEHGKSLEHSVGVSAVKKEIKDDVRNVSEWKLWEYSTLTGWGSNERTPLLSIKSADNVNDGIEWLNVMLKKGNYTDERFIEIEKQLSLLKTLVIEPSKDTQIIEPKNANNIVDAIKLFNALN